MTNEADYELGSRTAWQFMLQECQRQLGIDNDAWRIPAAWRYRWVMHPEPRQDLLLLNHKRSPQPDNLPGYDYPPQPLYEDAQLPTRPGEAWFRRVVVKAGDWPAADEANVPEGLLASARSYYDAMLNASEEIKS